MRKIKINICIMISLKSFMETFYFLVITALSFK